MRIPWVAASAAAIVFGACPREEPASGDITGVSVDPAGGLSGGGTSGDVALSLVTNCAAGQVLKWNGASWVCSNDVDSDTNAGGDVTAVLTGTGTGLVGGVSSGEAALSLLTTCTAGQLLKWTGNEWQCAADVDTDTNSGGDITDVVAGSGLVGGAAAGSAAVNVGAGTGITVSADAVALDTSFTDTRYLNSSGDSMTGNLNMSGLRVTNRGCPPGYVSVGSGLCIEDIDACCFTFSAAANRCRSAGTHLCTSAEMRAAMMSGVAIGAGGVSLDWLADQDGDDTALYVNNPADASNPEGSRATTTSSYSRCCASVE